MRSIIPLAILGVLMLPTDADARGFVDKQRGYDRVDAAFEAHDADLAALFAERGAAWPPEDVYLRVFKLEGAVELWAAPTGDETRLVLVKTFDVCRASGGLGPKVQQGDLQVPEGFYVVDRFNPRSSYHLSLGVDYPNAVDRARAKAASAPPGGDIFLHGSCVTIGCVPLQDGPMEQLYVVAVRARAAGQSRVPVHFFPCRFGTDACEAALREPRAADPALDALWTTLAEATTAFDATGRAPKVRVRSSGYTVTATKP